MGPNQPPTGANQPPQNPLSATVPTAQMQAQLCRFRPFLKARAARLAYCRLIAVSMQGNG